MITEALLRELFPRPRGSAKRQRIWDGYVQALLSNEAEDLFDRFEINSELRWAHFLANVGAETGGLQIMWESGAYSAQRIMQIFGVGKHSAKVTWTEAKRLAYNGPALFDRVYGIGNPRKVRELGNDEKGDGWKYRGVGVMQITGKRDHYRYAAMIGCDVEDLDEPINSIHAALLEWNNKGCNAHADRDDVKKVRRLINGGYNGLDRVRGYLAHARKLLKDLPEDSPMIALGDSGPTVAWLQERLKVHGYPLGEVDGIFGPLTERALVSFQLQHAMNPTGVLDRKDAEIMAALEEEPAPDPVVASRDVTKEDLKERGSETVATTSFWKRIMQWIFGASAFASADASSGLGLMDSGLGLAERVIGTADRTQNVVTWIPDWRIVILLGVCLGAFVLWRAFNSIERRRVEDARSGVHLGR